LRRDNWRETMRVVKRRRRGPAVHIGHGVQLRPRRSAHSRSRPRSPNRSAHRAAGVTALTHAQPAGTAARSFADLRWPDASNARASARSWRWRKPPKTDRPCAQTFAPARCGWLRHVVKKRHGPDTIARILGPQRSRRFATALAAMPGTIPRWGRTKACVITGLGRELPDGPAISLRLFSYSMRACPRGRPGGEGAE